MHCSFHIITHHTSRIAHLKSVTRQPSGAGGQTSQIAAKERRSRPNQRCQGFLPGIFFFFYSFFEIASQPPPGQDQRTRDTSGAAAARERSQTPQDRYFFFIPLPFPFFPHCTRSHRRLCCSCSVPRFSCIDNGRGWRWRCCFEKQQQRRWQ